MAHRTLAWTQLNVSLARPGGSALPSARVLLRELEAALADWRRQRVVSRFFFQRKPPDLRLRFLGPREGVLVRLRPLMARMRSGGHVLRSVSSVYEPEERLFGGPECMGHVHAYWDADSLAWIMLDRLIESETCRVSHPGLITGVLNDLFGRALPDAGEVWDTWCNLAVLLGDDGQPAVPPSDPPWPVAPTGRTCAAEAAILTRCQDANERLAAGLLRTWERGRMRCGMRSILPSVALFTLNRHGFDQREAAMLARGMAAAWNPKRRLRGSLPDPRPDKGSWPKGPRRGANLFSAGGTPDEP